MARTFPNNAANYMSLARQWAHLTSPDGDRSFSIHGWVKLASTANDQTLVASYPLGPNGFGILLRVTGAKFGAFWGDAGLSGQESITTTSFTAGVWTPFGCKYDGATNTMRTYIYGVQEGSDSSANVIGAPIGTWRLGLRGNGANPLNGDLAEIAMWSGRALTDAEFAALAKGAPPSKMSPYNLVGYWPLYGVASPEPNRGCTGEVVGGPMVVTGTLAAAAHPPVGAGGGKGGGIVWDSPIISEDGSSLTNFTVDSGTWAINSGVIRCTANGGGTGRLRHNTDAAGQSMMREYSWEMKILSTSVADQSRAAGLMLWDGSGAAAPSARLMWRTAGNERCELELDSTAAVAGVDFAFSLDTWYRMRDVHGFHRHDIYVDDAFVVGGLATPNGTIATANRYGLIAQNSIAEFRNIQLKVLS
jgi:hypothetical protein